MTCAWQPGWRYDDTAHQHWNVKLLSNSRTQFGRLLTKSEMSHLRNRLLARQNTETLRRQADAKTPHSVRHPLDFQGCPAEHSQNTLDRTAMTGREP